MRRNFDDSTRLIFNDKHGGVFSGNYEAFKARSFVIIANFARINPHSH